MGTMGRCGVVAMLAMSAATPERAVAQTASAPEDRRVGVALDVGFGPGTEGVAAYLGLTVVDDWGDLTLRGALGSAKGLVDIFGTEEEAVSDVALLYGRRTNLSRGWLTVAAGPGLASLSRRGAVERCEAVFFCTYHWHRTQTLGLAVEAEAVWSPWSVLGLGVKAFGNANGQASFGGIAVGLHLGSLR